MAEVLVPSVRPFSGRPGVPVARYLVGRAFGGCNSPNRVHFGRVSLAAAELGGPALHVASLRQLGYAGVGVLQLHFVRLDDSLEGLRLPRGFLVFLLEAAIFRVDFEKPAFRGFGVVQQALLDEVLELQLQTAFEAFHDALLTVWSDLGRRRDGLGCDGLHFGFCYVRYVLCFGVFVGLRRPSLGGGVGPDQSLRLGSDQQRLQHALDGADLVHAAG